MLAVKTMSAEMVNLTQAGRSNMNANRPLWGALLELSDLSIISGSSELSNSLSPEFLLEVSDAT